MASIGPTFSVPSRSLQFRRLQSSSMCGQVPRVAQDLHHPRSSLPMSKERLHRRFLAAAAAVATRTDGTKWKAGQNLLHLLWTALLFGGTYAWFLKGTQIVDSLVSFSPKLEAAAFLMLACGPLLAVRYGLFSREIRLRLQGLAAMHSSLLWKHTLAALENPLAIATSTFLLFLTVNLVARGLSHDFAIALPPHLLFLDPSGDGILTAMEIESSVLLYSRGLFLAILRTCLCWFLVNVKRPPNNFKIDGGAAGLVQKFWHGLTKRHGTFVIADLVTTSLLLAGAILVWLRVLGLDARTVLTFGGLGGIAFGLAAQNLVGNFISGLLLLITQPFQVGDHIESGEEAEGQVKRIGWSFTDIENSDGLIVRLPNTSLVDKHTRNKTKAESRFLTISLPLRFPKNGFSSRCEELLNGIADHVSKLDVCKAALAQSPRALFTGIDPEGDECVPRISVILKFRTDKLSQQSSFERDLSAIRSKVTIAVMQFLQAEGCEIPGLEREE